jgi:L-fuconolactonase
VKHDLEPICADPKLRAIRHVIQDEPDDHFVARDDFNRGVSLLKEFNLAFDILVFERHLPNVIRFVDRHPDQTFILDHLAKPKIKIGEREPWAKNIKELGKRSNVYCKASGIATEADWQSWTAPQLREYFDIALDAFGPSRLMAASDWPVCLVACGYKRWMDILREWTSSLSSDEREKFFGLNRSRKARRTSRRADRCSRRRSTRTCARARQPYRRLRHRLACLSRQAALFLLSPHSRSRARSCCRESE